MGSLHYVYILGFCGLKDSVLAYMMSLTRLKTLILGGCPKLTSEGFQFLSHLNFKELVVDACDNLNFCEVIEHS